MSSARRPRSSRIPRRHPSATEVRVTPPQGTARRSPLRHSARRVLFEDDSPARNATGPCSPSRGSRIPTPIVGSRRPSPTAGSRRPSPTAGSRRPSPTAGSRATPPSYRERPTNIPVIFCTPIRPASGRSPRSPRSNAPRQSRVPSPTYPASARRNADLSYAPEPSRIPRPNHPVSARRSPPVRAYVIPVECVIDSPSPRREFVPRLSPIQEGRQSDTLYEYPFDPDFSLERSKDSLWHLDQEISRTPVSHEDVMAAYRRIFGSPPADLLEELESQQSQEVLGGYDDSVPSPQTFEGQIQHVSTPVRSPTRDRIVESSGEDEYVNVICIIRSDPYMADDDDIPELMLQPYVRPHNDEFYDFENIFDESGDYGTYTYECNCG